MRILDCLTYDILDIRGHTFQTDSEGVSALEGWGFKVPERIQTATTVDEILEYHAAYGRDRDALDYEIDGVVIKLNALDDRADLGFTSRHPRWALAFKYIARKEVTRIKEIVVQVGRSGVLTPVADLEEVVVGGVTVSRATLHNREELLRKDIREGDLVRVQRAGDVIPQVVEVIEEAGRERSAPFTMPVDCPNCGSAVVVKGPFTYCPNRFGCTAQLKERLAYFASRDAFDIEGLGGETAELLVDRELVSEPADLFRLTVEDLLPLPGFAEKSAEKLVQNIQARRRVELARFIVALGIPEVGVAVARDLAAHFHGLEPLLNADESKLQEIRGVGSKMANQNVEFFHEEGSRPAIQRLAAEIHEFILPEVADGDGPLSGIKFVFTGGMDSMSRSQAKKLVESAGARVMSSVSAETDIVVAGEGSGSKMEKALSLGLTILDEAGFLKLLEEKGING
jgi:DNA ligase (NAD+)